MNTYLWKLKEEKLKKTNLFLYSDFIKKNFKIDSNCDFNKIWEWSIENPKIFWKSIWDFTKVKGILGNTLLQESKISLASSLNGKPIIPLSYSSIVSTAKCVFPVLVGPRTAVILFKLFSINCV